MIPKDVLRASGALTEASRAVEMELDLAWVQDQLEARSEHQLRENLLTTLRDNLTTYGLTQEAMYLCDPTYALLTQLNLPTDVSVLSVAQKQRVQTLLLSQIDTQLGDAVGVEGVRETLHSKRFRSLIGFIGSILVPTGTLSELKAGNALYAAKASGDAAKITAAKAAVATAKQGIIRSLFRAVIIGTIAQSLIESAVKVADNIVNAGRVYGTAGQVSDNIVTIKKMLAKVSTIASIKIAADGSNLKAVQTQLNDLLDQVDDLYDQADSYKMVRGSESGWTESNIPNLAKQFDNLVNQTGDLDNQIKSLATQEKELNDAPPPENISDMIERRNETTVKALKTVRKLVRDTTTVFEDLRHFIDKKGVGGLNKNKTADTSKNKSA